MKRRASLAVTIIVLFSLHFIFPHLYGSIFYPITSFFWKSGSFVGDSIGHYADLVSSKRSLIDENERLRREATSFTPSLLMLDSLRKENDTLKSLLGRHVFERMTLATVLSRPPFSAYDSLVIDIGSSDGVAVGDAVYASSDVLIGDITEIYSGSSKVGLFSSPGRRFPVLVGASSVQVEAEGRGAGNFRATLPSEIGVEAGDTVRFAQYKPNILGVVEKVVLDSTDSLQEVFFKMPINISELSYVEVGARIATSTPTKRK